MYNSNQIKLHSISKTVLEIRIISVLKIRGFSNNLNNTLKLLHLNYLKTKINVEIPFMAEINYNGIFNSYLSNCKILLLHQNIELRLKIVIKCRWDPYALQLTKNTIV